MEDLKIPSKTFLLGEYAVLYGAPSVVLAHPPFFSLKKSGDPKLFHKDSPAARLMRSKGLQQDFEFIDPHNGGGGFGGSTAEVVAALKNRSSYSAESLLRDYFELFLDQKVAPSGADLYTQWSRAKDSLIKASITLYDKSDLASSRVLKWPFEDVAVIVFKRPKKVKTHNHLGSLNLEGHHFDSLVEISKSGVESLLDRNQAFFRHIDEFSDEQRRLSLLDENSSIEIQSIKDLEPVITARGCGALGADVVSVFCKINKDSNKEDLDKVKAKIVDFGFNYAHIATLDPGDFISD